MVFFNMIVIFDINNYKMKDIQVLLTTFICVFLISACGSDSCSADDWAGTWVGTITDFDGSEEETTVTIVANGDSISFVQDGQDLGDYMVAGCSIMDSRVESTFLGDVSLALDLELKGDVITFDLTVELLGETTTERGVLNRQ